MGSLAYTGILGNCEQRVCLYLSDRHGVFQLLAHGEAGYSREYELCSLSNGGSCNRQPGLLPRLGEESIYRTGDRGGLNAGRSSPSLAFRVGIWTGVSKLVLRQG